MNLKSAMALAFGLAVAGASHAATELVIATVNNGHMIEMQKLTKFFEQANPDIKVKWVTLEEGVLRQRVTTDIATKGGQYDIITIGTYEVPIWAKQSWLVPLDKLDYVEAQDDYVALHSAGKSSRLDPSDWKIRLMFAFCKAKPIWIPKKPKLRFHSPAKDLCGFCTADV